MIKIRLHGDLKEINKAIESINESFKIISISRYYDDRNSDLKRCYLDCEINTNND